jgi:thioredoxin 1
MNEITEKEFLELQESNKKILIDLYAPWCGPCKMLMPRIERISSDFPNVEFVKMDVDKNVDFAVKHGVRSVPTILIFDGQNIVNKSVGVNHDQFYVDILKTL